MALRQPVTPRAPARSGPVLAILAALGLGAAAWFAWPEGETASARDEIVVVPGSGAAAPTAPEGPTLTAVPSGGPAFAPNVIEGRVAGYAITADSDAAWLDRARLRVGDVILDLDGRALEPARLPELAAADAVEVTYLRDGQLRKRQLRLAP